MLKLVCAKRVEYNHFKNMDDEIVGMVLATYNNFDKDFLLQSVHFKF